MIDFYILLPTVVLFGFLIFLFFFIDRLVIFLISRLYLFPIFLNS
jgi:hypothetical protein